MDKIQPTLCGFPIIFTDKLPSYNGAVILGCTNKSHTEDLQLRESPADSLLHLARVFKYPKDKLIIADKSVPETVYNRIKLALRFEQLGPRIHFRAIVEGWDAQRIIRECY